MNLSINSLLTYVVFQPNYLLSDLTKVNLFEFFERFNWFINFQNIIQITVHQTKASCRLAIKLGIFSNMFKVTQTKTYYLSQLITNLL